MAKRKIPHPRKTSRRRLVLVGRPDDPTEKPPKPRRWTDDEVRTVVEFAILGRELEVMTALSAQLITPQGRWWRLGPMDVSLATGGSATGDLKHQLISSMPRVIALVNQLGRDPQAGPALRALVAPIATGLIAVVARRRGVRFPLDPWCNDFLAKLPTPVLAELHQFARRRHWRKFSALALQHGHRDGPEWLGYLKREFEQTHAAEREAGSVAVWLRRQLDEQHEASPPLDAKTKAGARPRRGA